MSKTIRDLFTDEEWDILSQKYLPQLIDIANLPIPEEMQEKRDDYEA